jgi:hypothetical protein
LWEYVYPQNEPQQQKAIRKACGDFFNGYKESKDDMQAKLEGHVNSRQLGLTDLGIKHGSRMLPAKKKAKF